MDKTDYNKTTEMKRRCHDGTGNKRYDFWRTACKVL